MWILAGVPLCGGVKEHWGLSTTAMFGDFGGYVFEEFRDRCSVHCTIMLASLGRHAQLTLYFSAVAELLINTAALCQNACTHFRCMRAYEQYHDY